MDLIRIRNLAACRSSKVAQSFARQLPNGPLHLNETLIGLMPAACRIGWLGYYIETEIISAESLWVFGEAVRYEIFNIISL